MIRTSYQGIKAFEDDGKEGRKQEWRWKRVTDKRMTEGASESSVEGSDMLGGKFR